MRTLYALPALETVPYEQTAAHGYVRGPSEKCVRCGRGLYCQDQSEEGEQATGAWCSYCGAPAPVYVFGGQTVDPTLRSKISASDLKTACITPGQSTARSVKGNAPGRKRVHASAAAKQRAYRDRKRRAS